MLADNVRDTCRCAGFERFFIEQLHERGEDRKRLKKWGYLENAGNVYCSLIGSYAPGWLFKKDGLYMPGQEGRASALEDDGLYPVFPFSTGEMTLEGSLSAERALLLADAIIRLFLQDVRMQTAKGVLAFLADSRLTSLWVYLCESFREARIGAYKGCGLPVIAIGERGAKRLYCSDSCKRMYKCALRYAALVNNEDVEPAVAAKETGIAEVMALRMLERNGIEVNPAQ